MKKKTLYLLCGPAASGKSTYAKSLMNDKTAYVSRDEIRFSLLDEEDGYFDREDDVFDSFIYNINKYLADDSYDAVIADATHITESSRNKTLRHLNLTNVNIIPINFKISTPLALKRNDERSGRAKVPRNVIVRMCNTFVPANQYETYKYYNIMEVVSNE